MIINTAQTFVDVHTSASSDLQYIYSGKVQVYNGVIDSVSMCAKDRQTNEPVGDAHWAATGLTITASILLTIDQRIEFDREMMQQIEVAKETVMQTGGNVPQIKA